ncbi:MAG: response regulator [Treponema sp.]|jgi:signal transduction histidine kinase/CheY-like chemotaxis protein/HPt (histidine-containing phosphotransfer) domain-containing protein|nr:response regulator [Treponema sp.]
MKFKGIMHEHITQLLFIFLAFALMVLVSYFFVSNIVERQVRSNTEKVFHVAETTIHSYIREAEVVLLSMAESVQYKLESGQSPAEIRSYISDLTHWLTRPENSVSGLTDMRGYIQGEYIDGMGWTPPETYIPWERPWYTGALAAGDRIARSEPYDDPRSGKRIISFSKALRGSGGEVYGALVFPVDMAVISDYVKNIQFAEGGYGMLVDQNFVFIVHPENEYVDRPLAEFSHGHARMAEELAEGRTGISTVRVINAQGVAVMLSFKRIFNGWFIGIAIPVASYYHDAYLMALVLSLLGLIFMSVLSFFLIRLSMQKRRSDEENKSKSSFLARMSHEIRTPMNSILGMAELIMRKDISVEIQEYISIISQSGHTLLAIINDILDFSKITSGRFRIEPRTYRLSSLINDTINVIRMRVLEKPVDFVVNVDGDIPAQLYGDDVRVRQILINLLNNAVKYTPKGYIVLDIQKGAVDNHRLSLIMSVKDTGVGIKAENLEYLFSDFTRFEVNSNQGVEGTGLGLAITDALCRAMDGAVTVTSEYGKGSTFTATIIQSYEDDRKLAQVDRPGEKRVLLFEDRPHYLQSLTQTFTNLGVDPVCSPSLDEFTTALAKSGYDYAFVSSLYAMDCIHILGKYGSSIQLVIMVELGDVSVFREVSSIMMPVYSVSVANVLNGTVDGGVTKYLQPRFDFTAPGARVLIVDDISSNLRVAKELMAPYKMDVHTCLSGAEAVKLLQENRYDVIFMDHMMPGMDGLEAAAAIRAGAVHDEYFQKVPIIALTANAISGQREMFLQKGLNDFIAKPIEVKQLNAVLERWIPEGKKNKVPPPAAEETEAETPNIPGINTLLGLRNVNGSVDVYLDILAEFCQNMEDIQIRIGDAREAGDAGSFADSMHALKGASRGIGALDLGSLAEEMENAVRQGNVSVIDRQTDTLLKDIRSLVNNIYTASAARRHGPTSQEPVDISLLQLGTLKEALVNMDIAAVNRILTGYMSMPMDDNTKDLISQIERHVLMFEYEEAVEKINRLL